MGSGSAGVLDIGYSHDKFRVVPFKDNFKPFQSGLHDLLYQRQIAPEFLNVPSNSVNLSKNFGNLSPNFGNFASKLALSFRQVRTDFGS